MIEIPMVKKSDLEFFEGRDVLLLTKSFDVFDSYNAMKRFNARHISCCTLTPISFKRKFKYIMAGMQVVSTESLSAFLKEKNPIVQIVAYEKQQIDDLTSFASQFNLECSPLAIGEISTPLFLEMYLENMRNPLQYLYLKYKHYKNENRIFSPKFTSGQKCKLLTNPILICSPMKTADYTLMVTLDFNNLTASNRDKRNVEYLNLWHNPKYFKKFLNRKNADTVKFIMGIREPISQNLSMFYQVLSGVKGSCFIAYHELCLSPFYEKNKTLDKYEQMLIENKNDAQVWWNMLVDLYMRFSGEKKKDLLYALFIQSFVLQFSSSGLDITDYVFDQEKGYTIIKKNNVEVFVYQLEKLNSLVSELSNWVGVPFDKLEKGNAAEDKWIADSYKQAQKEIEITQEYFDKCFDEPYVKHCYSEADIEKFKARWRPHIKKQADANM